MEMLDVKEPLTIAKHSKNRRCDFCNSEEGKPRVVGRFIVQLRSVDVLGVKKLACQTCFRKNKEILDSKEFNNEKSMSENYKQNYNISFHFKQMISKMLHVFTFMLLLSTVVMAQPEFPGDPAQSPIDGGLGILAAVGGIYAYKKLKARRDEKSRL